MTAVDAFVTSWDADRKASTRAPYPT